jgi:hypothetical protein
MTFHVISGPGGPSWAFRGNPTSRVSAKREARSLTNTEILDVLQRVDSPSGSTSQSAGPAPLERALLPDSPGFRPPDLTTDNPAVQERRRAQRLRQSTCRASRRPDASGKTRGGSRGREEATARPTGMHVPAGISATAGSPRRRPRPPRSSTLPRNLLRDMRERDRRRQARWRAGDLASRRQQARLDALGPRNPVPRRPRSRTLPRNLLRNMVESGQATPSALAGRRRLRQAGARSCLCRHPARTPPTGVAGS